jgi:putative FmdB family regulatory protein
MPLYEYECFLCGERFERIQKVSDPPIETCPFCQGAVRRLLGVPALQFKGSGFYITDYVKKDKPQEATEPATASTAEKPKASASSSESKGSKPSGGDG